MLEESENNSSIHFVTAALPVLLATGMLAVYLLTLNHWVSPESLELIASASGLNYRPEFFGSVTFLVTWPFRWLPTAWIPLALNLFTACCAGLSLTWLAQAVALLPHDQTETQRLRLNGDVPLLTIRTAWLPPVLAVLVCGLQLTFWEHAIAASGEMLNLLLFAWLVRSVMKTRLDANNARLPGMAFVYGLAAANTWTMAAFGPLLLLAALWAARANPFSERFLERIITEANRPSLTWFAQVRNGLQPFNPRLWAASLACLMAGLSFFLLMPLLASCREDEQPGFISALLITLRIYVRLLVGVPKPMVLLLCLASVLPAVFIAIRWRGLAGTANTAGKINTGLFHCVHGFLLAVSLWSAFDLPLSPRRLNLGFTCLPLCFLTALSAGYFTGYFLLISSHQPRNAKHRLGSIIRFLKRSLPVGGYVALMAGLILLLWKNLPRILWDQNRALEIYANLLEKCLPEPGAIILGNDSFRLLCLQATLTRHRQAAEYLAIDISLLLQQPAYLESLARQHPEFDLHPPRFQLASDLTNGAVLIDWVQDLAAAHPVYYLNPLVGRLGEAFSNQPQGLFYRLNPRTSNVPESPSLPEQLLLKNQAFWRSFASQPLGELVRHTQPVEQFTRTGHWQQILESAQFNAGADDWMRVVGSWCAAALNAWGVELQRSGFLPEAHESFRLALQLTPANMAAQLNCEFNQAIQAHKPAVTCTPEQVQARFAKRRSWEQIISMDGPIDEPNSCFALGRVFAEAGLPRQAIEQFARSQHLVPGHPDTAFRLAEQFLFLADYSNALAAANQVLKLAPGSTDALLIKGCSLLGLQDYPLALDPLTQALSKQSNPRANLARGLAHLELGNFDAAQQDYQQAARLLTNACPAWYGLAEVAYRRKDPPALIKYGSLLLSNAPPSLPEYRLVAARLAELRP